MEEKQKYNTIKTLILIVLVLVIIAICMIMIKIRNPETFGIPKNETTKQQQTLQPDNAQGKLTITILPANETAEGGTE